MINPFSSEPFLVSNIFIIPSAKLNDLELLLEDFENPPNLINITPAIDGPLVSSKRQFPHLIYLRICEQHDGFLIDSEDEERYDIGEILLPFVLEGTTIKFQKVEIDKEGMYYSSLSYTHNEPLKTVSDHPLEIPEIHLPTYN